MKIAYPGTSNAALPIALPAGDPHRATHVPVPHAWIATNTPGPSGFSRLALAEAGSCVWGG
ncbi:MAG TPA: hypothetical protein VGF88_09155 [Acidobacteriaceae bacterium]